MKQGQQNIKGDRRQQIDNDSKAEMKTETLQHEGDRRKLRRCGRRLISENSNKTSTSNCRVIADSMIKNLFFSQLKIKKRS